MPKRKVTSDMLSSVELHAEDYMSLDDILIELDLVKTLSKNEEILQAYERGKSKLFIEQVVLGKDQESISDACDIDSDTYKLWLDKFAEAIDDAIQIKKDDAKYATKQFSSPMIQGVRNIAAIQSSNTEEFDMRILRKDIEGVNERLYSGDMQDVAMMLTTNVMQLQSLNEKVAQNIVGEAGKTISNFEKLIQLQLKVAAESRKQMMAINEIVNPKHATFIKKAEQHNHLHQVSEKKEQNENELSQLKHTKEGEQHAYQYTDAETVTKRENNEDKALEEIDGPKDS